MKVLTATVPVSVVILTLNEEINLAECLASLAGFDDVVVLDSGSSDSTQAIARAQGVPVYEHAFAGFGQQRNWAIDQVPARYPWQFHIDADERMTPELAAEMTALVAADPPEGGYLVPSKLLFAGRWLKRAGQYPGYQVRFFHRDRLRFVDHGHGQREVTSFPVGCLQNPLLHYPLSKGIDGWFARHIPYARHEAEQALHREAVAMNGSLFSLNGTSRRRALKRLVRRLPGRYFLRLAYMLFVQGALLEGWAGVTYSQMLATYEAMMEVYLRMLRQGVKP
jgi:glycosyltransferase involved in cell wall biosynthesis